MRLKQGCPKCGPWEEYLRPQSGFITYLNYIAYDEENLAVVDTFSPGVLIICIAINQKVMSFQT